MAGKQPNQVRGNIIQCPNFVQCTLCYGCRNCDMRLNECRECYEQGKTGSNRNFNVCNKNIHTEDALNKMKHTHKIELTNCIIKKPS